MRSACGLIGRDVSQRSEYSYMGSHLYFRSSRGGVSETRESYPLKAISIAGTKSSEPTSSMRDRFEMGAQGET